MNEAPTSGCMSELGFAASLARQHLKDIGEKLDLLERRPMPDRVRLETLNAVNAALDQAYWAVRDQTDEVPGPRTMLTFAQLNYLDDESAPLVYVWRIGFDVYVGKSKNGIKRAINEYRNNVRKLLAGLPYRKSKPDQFRRVHRRLTDAVRNGESITLELLPSTLANLNADERRLIHELKATLNGSEK